jgi:hypothetical protein
VAEEKRKVHFIACFQATIAPILKLQNTMFSVGEAVVLLMVGSWAFGAFPITSI